jgi:hypothetical protein
MMRLVETSQGIRVLANRCSLVKPVNLRQPLLVAFLLQLFVHGAASSDAVLSLLYQRMYVNTQFSEYSSTHLLSTGTDRDGDRDARIEPPELCFFSRHWRVVSKLQSRAIGAWSGVCIRTVFVSTGRQIHHATS